ncbi:MAG: hypothetical protein M5R42_19445 [Rhodocyclaceae bacterium]|nr:hypothetical protein [Rhodocyclaceae bacterium]
MLLKSGLLTAALTAPAWAQPEKTHPAIATGTDSMAEPPSRLAAYLYGKEQIGALYAVGRQWDKKLGLQQGCKDSYNIQPAGLFLLKPIDFPRRQAASRRRRLAAPLRLRALRQAHDLQRRLRRPSGRPAGGAATRAGRYQRFGPAPRRHPEGCHHGSSAQAGETCKRLQNGRAHRHPPHPSAARDSRSRQAGRPLGGNLDFPAVAAETYN